LLAAPAVDASVSVGSSVRQVFFRDRLTPTLAGWKSGALILGGFSLQAYPSTGKLPVIDDIGPYLGFARSLKSQTLTADGTLAFSTQETTWEMGLRWRGLFNRHALLSFGYGSLSHDFSGARLPGFLLPAGAIQYWRPGLEGRFELGRVVLTAGAAYLLLVRQDFLSANFPRAKKGGFDVGARASLRVWKVELSLSGKYTRFFYSLHPLPYDPYIAGGALDEVFAVDLACGYRL
jgi:hypothetical protein